MRKSKSLLTLTIFNVIFNIIKKEVGENMPLQVVPEWMASLEDEDAAFIRRFVLASGSLKEVARQYGVTYPTVRLRLDRLIEKIQLAERSAQEPYIALIRRLAVDERIDVDAAKLLISEYKKLKGAKED